MRRRTLSVVLVIALAGCGPVPDAVDLDAKPVRLLPMMPVDSLTFKQDDEHMIARVAIENTSGDNLFYACEGENGNVMLVEAALHDDNKRLGLHRADEPRTPTKGDVARVRPGRVRVFTISIRSLVPDIKPGKYRLDLSYHVPKDSKYVTELELTPMSWEASLPVEIK